MLEILLEGPGLGMVFEVDCDNKFPWDVFAGVFGFTGVMILQALFQITGNAYIAL